MSVIEFWIDAMEDTLTILHRGHWSNGHPLNDDDRKRLHTNFKFHVENLEDTVLKGYGDEDAFDEA